MPGRTCLISLLKNRCEPRTRRPGLFGLSRSFQTGLESGRPSDLTAIRTLFILFLDHLQHVPELLPFCIKDAERRRTILRKGKLCTGVVILVFEMQEGLFALNPYLNPRLVLFERHRIVERHSSPATLIIDPGSPSVTCGSVKCNHGPATARWSRSETKPAALVAAPISDRNTVG